MKKILSVVLAGAMILGMSVTSFAKDFVGGDKGGDRNEAASSLVFNNVSLNGKAAVAHNAHLNGKDSNLKGGDVLYFLVEDGSGALTKAADNDWKIKINNAEYVEDAVFFVDGTDAKNNKVVTGGKDEALYVKVTLENDFDNFDEDVEFYFYIADENGQSEKVSVSYKYEGLKEVELKKSDLDWVLTVDKAKTYKYKKGEKSGVATIDMNGILAELKMYAGEKYSIDPDLHYDKDLSKEYDVDVELLTVRDDMETLFFKADKDNKMIVALDKDGDLVEVDAKYVTDYKFGSGKRVDGYLVENVKYGKYAKVSNKIELNDKKDEDKVDEDASKPTADTTKPNPNMGANDFVGAAVALAVVSVAAAGALSLKK